MIKVGDLVMIVKPTNCCGNPSSLGQIFTVSCLETETSDCIYCGYAHEVTIAEDSRDKHWVDLNRLIKIDPPQLQEETTKDEELLA
jgi:hypothetical protein